ncbi:MAG TPA: L-threonylcarbamoyladenylate synthase [Acidimicrobiales bacterium]|jgi:L-threonylcarbamoyladenylate synthase|nr:L-threonylcarbamoyladenylate synthase [Acidimicrobiales bacterium]
MTVVVDAQEAVVRLRRGSVVAVPTDTVYGLAASLAHPDAVATLFRLKRRPTSVALPVLVESRDAIDALEVAWPEKAKRLSDALWPGPLTIVVPVDPRFAAIVGGVETVGFRVPNDELLLEVIEQCGALAVSSANEHGEPPCHSAEEVLRALGSNGLLDAVLNAGERSGDVSTVVEIKAASWRILRSGAISDEEIERLLA